MKGKYQIYWAELTPEKGIVTKKDRKKFGDILCIGRITKLYKHFLRKEDAVMWLNTFSKKLDKKYSAKLFTDAQLAKSKKVDGCFSIPFTKKQLSEIYYL